MSDLSHLESRFAAKTFESFIASSSTFHPSADNDFEKPKEDELIDTVTTSPPKITSAPPLKV